MSTKLDASSTGMVPSHRGFIYFCEESLRYTKGPRAWLFFVPYLLGAVWLEPGLSWNKASGDLWPSVLLLVYLLVFPPIWRAFLLRTGLWKKRAGTSAQVTSVGRPT